MYRTIARFIPRKVRENFKLLIKQTDVKTDADALLVIIFIFYIITIYMILIVKSNKKSKEIELVLHDALQLMSGNLRAGLTTDRALLLSSREEFGHLKAEGELADLLDQTAENLRNEKVIDEKVRSNILLYVIFIFIAVGLGAPVLFGLSSYLVEIMTATLANVDIPPTAQTANLPLSLTKVTI